MAPFGSRLRRGCGATSRTSLRGRPASAGSGVCRAWRCVPATGQALVAGSSERGCGVTDARVPSGGAGKARAGSPWSSTRRELPAWVNRTMRTRERASRFQSRTARDRGAHSNLRSSGALGVGAIPAADRSRRPGGVEDARLPGTERVADRADLDVDHGIGAAVLPGDGPLAGRSRPGEEGDVRRAAAEDDRMMVRMARTS